MSTVLTGGSYKTNSMNNFKLKTKQRDSLTPKEDPINMGHLHKNFDNKSAHNLYNNNKYVIKPIVKKRKHNRKK